MKMFLGAADSADIRNSIFHTERLGPGSQNPGSSSDSVYARIDNERGLLVLHPDLLISPTKIAEAIGCVRRGVISERVKSLGGFNKAAVLGNLRHSFIEVRYMLWLFLFLLIFVTLFSCSAGYDMSDYVIMCCATNKTLLFSSI